MKLPLYVYSTKNLVGSGLTIISLGLYLTGVVQDYWWLIAATAYGAGAIGAPGNSKLDVEMRKEMNDQDILNGLNAMVTRVPQLLPDKISEDVVSICENLKTLIPSLTRSGSGGQVAFDIRTIATEYLPQTLEAYLRLPKAFRVIAKSSDGKDADQMLGEQISTLKIRLEKVTESVASADAASLAENGRFLQERFNQADFTKSL